MVEHHLQKLVAQLWLQLVDLFGRTAEHLEAQRQDHHRADLALDHDRHDELIGHFDVVGCQGRIERRFLDHGMLLRRGSQEDASADAKAEAEQTEQDGEDFSDHGGQNGIN